MDIDRRSFLKGLGIGLTGGYLGYDLGDGDLDTPYQLSGQFLEELDAHLEPGDPVPDTLKAAMVPEEYQDYIDPSFDATQEELDAVPYHRDISEWKRPERYLAEGGDCEDYATAVASRIEDGDPNYGVNVQVVIGSLDGAGHVLAEDNTGTMYSVGDGAVQDLEGWEPVLAFSRTEELHAYRPLDPPSGL